MTKTYPGLNRLLVKQTELPQNESILASVSNNYAYGIIESVGTIKDKTEFIEGHFEKGDGVYYMAQAGINIDLPEGEYRLLTITDVLVGVKQ